jgi:predicted Zn-dependent peptidase
LGVRAYKRTHKNRWIMSVLTTMLGGNMSSRLFIQVRERRGLAYYVKSINQEYLDNGYLVTRLGTDIKKAKEAVKLVWEEYQKMSNVKYQISNIRKKELEKAKEYIKGKMVLELEDSQALASLYTEDWLLEGKVHTPQEIMKEIDHVSLEDIARVAKEIFQPKNLNLSIVGPYNEKDKEEFQRILK